MILICHYMFHTFSPFHLQWSRPDFARVLRDSDSSRQISILTTFVVFTRHVFRDLIQT